jgi:hypothetical protein
MGTLAVVFVIRMGFQGLGGFVKRHPRKNVAEESMGRSFQKQNTT